MPLHSPPNLDTNELRNEIKAVYGKVATAPDGEFHFHRGPGYAAEWLGYDAAELAQLPSQATASFAGVGCPISIGPFTTGETVLDIGSGAGMDALLAARRVPLCQDSCRFELGRSPRKTTMPREAVL